MKTILLVEDNEDDVFMTRNACMRSGLPHKFVSVSDGQAAIDYVAGNACYGDRNLYPFPDLILLDLKLPRRDGHEVLEWLRERAGLKSLPVIALTSSDRATDVERAYQLGVISYLRKEADVVAFSQGVRVIMKFWFDMNIPPP